MAQDFNNMTAKQIVIRIEQATDFNDVTKMLESLSPALLENVMDLYEQRTIDETRDMRAKDPAFCSETIEQLSALKDIFGGAASAAEREEEAEMLATMQTQSQMIKYIVDAKGDAAHPVIKETAKEIGKLSNSQYNKFPLLLAAHLRGYESVIEIAPPAGLKTNPFKKPQGPKQ